MAVRVYRQARSELAKLRRRGDGDEIVISDGQDLLLSPEAARELGQELLDAADRADRGDLDVWNKRSKQWED